MGKPLKIQTTLDNKAIPLTAKDCLKTQCENCIYMKADGNKDECPELWKTANDIARRITQPLLQQKGKKRRAPKTIKLSNNNPIDTKPPEKDYVKYILVEGHNRIVKNKVIWIRRYRRRNHLYQEHANRKIEERYESK